MRRRDFFFLLWLPVFLVAGGCAVVLPDVKSLIGETSVADTPAITDSRRPLTTAESKRIIDRLKRQVAPTDIIERYEAVMEEVSGNPLVKGNRATLLKDGPATFAAMFKAVEKAKESVNFETFIYEDDETGRKLADLLLRKRAEGVTVNLIYDSFGSRGTPEAFFERLRDGGIQTLEFNPVNLLQIQKERRVTHRDHRKILIVDGRVAITGGVNISRVYSSRFFGSQEGRKGEEAWRDTDVEIEGPVVAEFQKLFIDTWERQKGPELAERNYFPHMEQKGDALIRVLGSSPGHLNRTTFIMYVAAFICANNSIHLTNAYFVPDEQTIDALTEAARRGVDVKIILPASSDSSMALYAGRYYYSDLLKAGVKLYEHKERMVHAKTATIDGVWSTVGSTNLDFWSFAYNDEVNAVILSKSFTAQMETMFSGDLSESKMITSEEWNERPLSDRLREWLAHLFAHWL